MSGTVYQAAAGALLQQMRVDLLSNNLANVNTTGFKADLPVFRVNSGSTATGEIIPSASNLLSAYAPPMEARTDFTPGPMARTDNPLDVAIVGKGFFEVEAPDGPRFTRKGNFTINEQGVLSTADGWPVMGQGGAIAIDGSRVEISDQGEIFVDGEAVDSLRVVDFPEPYELKKSGETVFIAENGVEPQNMDDAEIQVAQGFLEKSNVDAIRTMTELIETMRVFEAYQRAIRSSDEATAKTVSEVGRSA